MCEMEKTSPTSNVCVALVIATDGREEDFFPRNGKKRIFKKRAKRKPKASNSKHGVEKGKVKSHQSKKIQLGGPKLPKPQVVLQKRKTRVKIAHRVEIAFKLYNLRGPKLPTSPKALFPASSNPKLKRNQRLGFALDSPHTTSTLVFALSKEAQAASPRDKDFGYK
ncbi:hypothetical protein Tco_1560747 [Tanacetum coccineum]